MQSEDNPHAIRGQSACNPRTIRMQSECNPRRWPSEARKIRGKENPRAIRGPSVGHPAQLPVSRWRGTQTQSVAITCEPVDSHPSGALLPRPRAVPGIPTVLLRELLGELELAPDEGRNQARSGRSSGAISDACEISSSESRDISLGISRHLARNLALAPFEVEPAAVVLHQPRVEHVREHLGREIVRVPK